MTGIWYLVTSFI